MFPLPCLAIDSDVNIIHIRVNSKVPEMPYIDAILIIAIVASWLIFASPWSRYD
jgi:hypothetical protein